MMIAPTATATEDEGQIEQTLEIRRKRERDIYFSGELDVITST
jgi:hypothetical protein